MIRSIAAALRPGRRGRLPALLAAAREAGRREAEAAALDDVGLFAAAEALSHDGSAPLDDGAAAWGLALAREAARRTLGLRPHDVQLAAALAIERGRLVEMRTGEGKTLAAALGAFLASTGGGGVHVVTVNDYLARRDGEAMGRVLKALGRSVGVVVSGLNEDERRLAYACDVVYATNAEAGFDHLRDNLRTDPSPPVQGRRRFAVVDEADSILIDEARTPLILSGPGLPAGPEPVLAAAIAASLSASDVEADRAAGSVGLTEAGHAAAEAAAEAAGGDGLSSAGGLRLLHALHQALRARHLMARDRDYVVRGGEVVVVDPMTGRLSPGRRYGDGLHQAVEVLEGLDPGPESPTLATVSYQNLFRGYDRLSGMSGTLASEARELRATYGLEVVAIPTHAPGRRVDAPDLVFRSGPDRDAAVVAEAVAASRAGRPVLVGTPSVERSEELAALLAAAGLARHDGPGRPPSSFAVLNARNHAAEAAVVAEAGRPGAVTVATNMAGRGTDVRLGGEGGAAADAALAAGAGGLLVLGAGRNASRRVDDQLRGRSGRQGDPGGSRFMVALDDPLVVDFAGDRLAILASSFEALEGEAIESAWAVGVRASVLAFDDVVEAQRAAVFARRERVLAGAGPTEAGAALAAAASVLAARAAAEPDGAADLFREGLGVGAAAAAEAAALAARGREADAAASLSRAALEAHAERRLLWGADADLVERAASLRERDAAWLRHVADLDDLRRVVAWRGVAQRRPVDEFRREAHDLFVAMASALAPSVARRLVTAVPRPPAGAAA